MFVKRKVQKKGDILEGIQITQTNEEEYIKTNEPELKKKIKVDNNQEQKSFSQDTKYKASFVLQNQNTSAVEKIEPEARPITNDITQTIQRLKSIHSVDEVKKGQALPPKKSTSLSTPITMPSNVKFSCTFDFNPMLCKDYHDTGYCTFGDSCIYIHDRGDYKSGWEMEKEYQEQLKKKKMGKQEQEDFEFKEKLEEYYVPENCGSCESPFCKPIQTKCGHFFCEDCIIKEKKCPQCGKPTEGIFHSATKLIQTLKEKRDKFILEYKPSIQKPQRFSEGDWTF